MAYFSRSGSLRRLLSPRIVLTKRLSCVPNNPHCMECGNRLMGHEPNPLDNLTESIQFFPMSIFRSPVQKELIDTAPIRSLQSKFKFPTEFGSDGLFSGSLLTRKNNFLRSTYYLNRRQLSTKSENPGTEPIPLEVVTSDELYSRSDAYAAIELALDAVVKVFTVTSSPNYFLPWQNKPQREITGSGFVISGRRILTNAHVVADQTFVLVRKHGSPTKYRAEVQAVGTNVILPFLRLITRNFGKE